MEYLKYNPIDSTLEHDHFIIDRRAENKFAAKTPEEQFQTVKKEIQKVKSGISESIAIERAKGNYLDPVNTLIQIRDPMSKERRN